MKKPNTLYRPVTKELKGYSLGKVHSALIGMLNELGIAGSTPTYNLYDAVAKEWEKAQKDIYPSEKLNDEDFEVAFDKEGGFLGYGNLKEIPKHLTQK